MRAFASAVFLILALTPVAVNAKCGTGNPPSYDDIEAVMLAQNYRTGSPDHPTRIDFTVPTIDGSTYWVFFWELSPQLRFPTVYSQFDLKGEVGTFHVSAKLADAIAVLRRHRFFSLSPQDHWVTDIAKTVLSVKRCAVIIRMSLYNMRDSSFLQQDEPTEALFDDLRALITNSKATRISARPKDFEETLLFDP